VSAPNSAQRARELLGHQLSALDELRNAHARDAGFKAWRQNTLTVIQRVWPNDPTRAERFRRVPFSAPSSKMSPVIMRSFYEKGCAEAMKLLRDYVAEASTSTLLEPEVEAVRDGFAPGSAEDDFPVLDLRDGPSDAPGDPGRVLEVEPALERDLRDTPPALDLGPVAEMLGPVVLPETPPLPEAGPPAPSVARDEPEPVPAENPDEMRDAQRALDAAIDAMGARPRPVTRVQKPGRDAREREVREREGSRDAERAPKPPRRDRHRPPSRNPLRDMLGFGDPSESPAPLEPPRAAEPTVTPEPSRAPEPAPPPQPPRSIGTAAEPVSGSAVPPERAPLSLVPGPLPRTLREVEPVGDAVIDFDLDDDPFAPPGTEEPAVPEPASPIVGDVSGNAPGPPVLTPVDGTVDAFMESSPVLSAAPRPVARPARTRADGPSPAGASLAALAGEVARLGVPEGHRAAARAELLDLARRFDSPQSLTWDSLRGVISFVMEYPPLARRVIPMLIPFLDIAA